MKVLSPTPEGINEAAEALRAGKIIAYPTETVYGLAVDPLNEGALARPRVWTVSRIVVLTFPYLDAMD